jgi:hypothetical protein
LVRCCNGMDGADRKTSVEYDAEHGGNSQSFNGSDEPSDEPKSRSRRV